MKAIIEKESFRWLIVVLMMSLALLAGCAEESPEEATELEGEVNGESNEDVTAEQDAGEGLEEVVVTVGGIGEGHFNEYFKEPIEEELPHITLEVMEDISILPEDLEQGIVAKRIPDLIYFSGHDHIQTAKDFELEYDLSELIAENNFDLNRIETSLLEIARSYEDGNDELYMLPLFRRTHNVYYNKGIFDTFGVSYPDDNMTIDEIIQLARDVTGEHDGSMYHGLDIMNPSTLLAQRNAVAVDPETDEPRLTSDPVFKEYFELLERLWSIPGIMPEGMEAGDYLWSWGGNFRSDQNVAMTLDWDRHATLADVEAETGLDWDVVTWPTWEDLPGVGPQVSSFYITMTSTTEHKDAAFEVLNHLFSDEYQSWRSAESGYATMLADPDVQLTYLTEHEHADILADKNIDSAFLLEPNHGLSSEELSNYEQYVDFGDGMLEDGTVEIYNMLARQEADVNTLLDEFQQRAEIIIEEAKARE